MLLHGVMQVSAKVDYGLRAMLELAARSQGETVDLVSAEELAHAQGIPGKFLEGILNQLRRSGLVISRRGAEGGYRLAKPADQITFAEVIGAIEGPLAGCAEWPRRMPSMRQPPSTCARCGSPPARRCNP